MPREFTCFDDSPLNNGYREVEYGWGIAEEEPDEDIQDEEEIEPHTENNF